MPEQRMTLPASLEDMVKLAQRRANDTKEAHGVWEHVGLYGYASGDIPARHTFRTQSFNRPEPDNAWALVACVDPEGV
jgi:hypothetical protein